MDRPSDSTSYGRRDIPELFPQIEHPLGLAL